jgi:uncharacterized protein (DUF849 family)
MSENLQSAAAKRQVIVTCAITGGGDTVGKHPAIPVTPEQIAGSALEAAQSGAAIVHIHVRDPKTGKPSSSLELYRAVTDRIRAVNTDVIINLTTGAGARFVPSDENPAVGGAGTTLMSPDARIRHVQELRPEICTLDITTMNFGEFAFVNVPAHIRTMAKAVNAIGVLPELELFDAGNLRLAIRLIEDGVLKNPAMFQICLGVPWGAPATSEAMISCATCCRRAAFGRASASVASNFRWWRRRSCSAVMSASASKITCILSVAYSRRIMRR